MLNLREIEKTPLQSKKFIAWFLAMLLTKIVLVYMITRATSDLVLLTTVITSGFLDIGYVLGQTALDIFVRALPSAKRLVELEGVWDPESKP